MGWGGEGWRGKMKDVNTQRENYGGVWKGAFFRNPGKAKTCGTGDVHPGFWLDK